MAKQKEIKWRSEGCGTVTGRKNGAVEQANEAASYLAEAFRAFFDQLAEEARAVRDAWGDIWGEIVAAAEFREAMRWAEAANRQLSYRYHHTKKKRIRKKYAKRILTRYRAVAQEDT